MRVKNAGFTMTELMITLVIMSILAAMAIPGYFQTVEQSRANEALTNLNIVHMGQKIYLINNGTYWNGGNGLAVGAINTALSVDLSATYYTTINITAVAGTSYTARFQRNNVQGGAGTKWYQYDFTTGNANPALTSGGSF